MTPNLYKINSRSLRDAKSTLRERHWKIGYGSDEDNLIVDFYIPALECALQYDRKAGFFNSSILSRVARGLGALLEN